MKAGWLYALSASWSLASAAQDLIVDAHSVVLDGTIELDTVVV